LVVAAAAAPHEARRPSAAFVLASVRFSGETGPRLDVRRDLADAADARRYMLGT